jgi:hypothetical protein
MLSCCCGSDLTDERLTRIGVIMSGKTNEKHSAETAANSHFAMLISVCN